MWINNWVSLQPGNEAIKLLCLLKMCFWYDEQLVEFKWKDHQSKVKMDINEPQPNSWATIQLGPSPARGENMHAHVNRCCMHVYWLQLAMFSSIWCGSLGGGGDLVPFSHLPFHQADDWSFIDINIWCWFILSQAIGPCSSALSALNDSSCPWSLTV